MTTIDSAPILFQVDSKSAPVVDSEKRTVKFTACKEQPVERYDWFKGEKYFLILSHDPKHVNLDRVTAQQCMFLKGHSGSWRDPDLLGTVTTAKLENGSLLTEHTIGADNVADQYWKNVQVGVVPGVSVEAAIKKLEVVRKAKYENSSEDDGEDRYSRKKLIEPAILKAVEWELLAIGSVHTPAVVGAARRLSREEEAPKNITVELMGLTGYEEILESKGQVNMSRDQKEIFSDLEKSHAGNPTEDKPSYNTKLADENRELKIKLSTAETEASKTKEQFQQLSYVCQYWQLRAKAIALYALENKMTEKDFNLNFAADPATDIEALKAKDPEDVRFDLRFLDRALGNFASSEPIERLSKPEDIAKIESQKLESNEGEEIKARDTKKSPDGSDNPTSYAQSIVDSLFK